LNQKPPLITKAITSKTRDSFKLDLKINEIKDDKP
jgi:hypothetical protein